MNKFLNSVALFNLYSSLIKLCSSIMYSSILKGIFDRKKFLNSVKFTLHFLQSIFTLKCVQGFFLGGGLLSYGGQPTGL